MSTLEKIASDGKTCIVFDNFQDILELDNANGILAQMRSTIQFQDKTPYFFTGSVRNDMMSIFDDMDSPFYKSALTFAVDEIDPARPHTSHRRPPDLPSQRRTQILQSALSAGARTQHGTALPSFNHRHSAICLDCSEAHLTAQYQPFCPNGVSHPMGPGPAKSSTFPVHAPRK